MILFNFCKGVSAFSLCGGFTIFFSLYFISVVFKFDLILKPLFVCVDLS